MTGPDYWPFDASIVQTPLVEAERAALRDHAARMDDWALSILILSALWNLERTEADLAEARAKAGGTVDRHTLIPKIGSHWVWEVSDPWARCLIRVGEVKWNGEEWWVCAEQLTIAQPIGEREPKDVVGSHWNDLYRFWEAVTPIGGRIADLCAEATRP